MNCAKIKMITKLLREKITQRQSKQPKRTICERCGQNNFIFAGSFCVDCWNDLESHRQMEVIYE